MYIRGEFLLSRVGEPWGQPTELSRYVYKTLVFVIAIAKV